VGVTNIIDFDYFSDYNRIYNKIFLFVCLLVYKNPMNQKADLNTVQQPITEASPEVRQIIERVLQLEKDKLYQRSPRNINEDIIKIIKEVVK